MFECAEIMDAWISGVTQSPSYLKAFLLCVYLSLSPGPPGGQEGGFDLWGFSSARKTVGIGNAQLLVK